MRSRLALGSQGSFPALLGRFFESAAVHLPTAVHLFLMGTLIMALVFWLLLAFWIVVRVIRTTNRPVAYKGEPPR